MNKKVLSAILFSALFAGTGTFTSCIDNDEPAGIEELRGAKAELLRAQAAMQLADEAFRMAQVANQELINEAKRIENQVAQIGLEMKELELKIQEAKAESEIQNYLLLKQQKENAIAVLAETFKADMLAAQEKTVRAQAALDTAIKDAELAKLSLSKDGKTLVETALAAMQAKQTAMTAAYGTLVTKQSALADALKGDVKTMTSLSKLQNALLVAQNNMKVEELKVADAERMLELAKSFDAETWSIQLDTLRADSLEAAQNKAAAQVALDALYAGAEYQAAEKAYQDAAEKLGMEFTPSTWAETTEKGKTGKVYTPGEAAEKVTEKFYNEGKDSTLYAKLETARKDSSNAVAGNYTYNEEKKLTTKFSLEAYESETVDAALQNFFNNAFGGLKDLTGYADNKFAYDYSAAQDAYTETSYRNDSVAYKEAIAEGAEYTIDGAESSAMKALMTVEGWVNALSTFKTDTNGIAWSQVGLDIAREDSAKAQAAFDIAKAKWQILVDAVNGKATVAPTDSVTIENGSETENFGFDEEVAMYNALVDSLVLEVANYNNAIDSLKKYEKSIYDTAFNDSVEAQKAEQYIKYYYEDLKTYYAVGTTEREKIDSLFNDAEETDVAKYNAFVSPTNAGKAKVYADGSLTTWLTAAQKTALETNAAVAGNKALETAYGANGVLTTLANNITAASDSVINVNMGAVKQVADAWEAIKTQYDKYIGLLAADYGQVIAAKNLNKVAGTGTDSIDVGEAEYNFDGGIKWDLIAKDFGGIADSETLKDKAGTADSTYTSLYDADGTGTTSPAKYAYLKVVGSDISDAEKANLSVTEIDKEQAIESLVEKSETAYGKIFDWKKNKEARLVEVTKEMISEHAASTTPAKKINEKSYGKLGALMEAEAAVELILAYKDADKLVEPLLAEIEAQFAALKAEIAANSAIVAAVEKIADDAWTAFEVGEAMVEKAKNDRDALSAEAEAEVELYEAIIAEKAQVLESAEQQLEALLQVNVSGSLTPEKLIHEWETKVATAQTQVENKKLEVIQAEKAIELYEAGEYTQAYEVAKAKLALEVAQADYDAAVKLYELAAAEFNAILEALAK